MSGGWWGGLVDLFVPRTCAGCGAETVTLCGVCLSHLDAPPTTVRPRYGTRSVTGAGAYSGPLRQVLIAYKELDRADVAPVLALLLAGAVVNSLADQVAPGPIVLVPVPASAASMRRRGGNHVTTLARAAARLLRADGLDVTCRELLEVKRHRDQVGQTRVSRRHNVRGTHRAVRGIDPAGLRDATVVVVDDICTSGATLAESSRALTAVQIPIDSLAVLAIAVESGTQEAVTGI